MASLRYSITCPCGQPREGKRPSKLTHLTCAKCGADLLVFPASPLAKLTRPAEAVKSATASPRWPWWKPLIAGGVSLLLFLSLFFWWLLSGPEKPDSQRPVETVEAEIRQMISEGRFVEATERLEKWIPTLPREPRAKVEHLLKQTMLVRDLLPERGFRFLNHAHEYDDRAWRDEFRRRYFNHPILLDAVLELDEEGTPRLTLPPTDFDGSVVLDVSDVRLMKALATLQPERFIFGLRLHDAKRTEQGGWRLTFQPDGGVLLTNPDVVRSLPDWSGAELRERIEKQMLRWEGMRRY